METMDSFGETIVNEIKARAVVPIPAWHFLLKRSVFWSLAIASVCFGAVAFAVADFVFFDTEGLVTTSLLDSPLEFLLQSIPIIWLVFFILFIASAFLGLRKTKEGYRFKTFWVVFTVIIATVCFGLLLNVYDFGQAVHDYLLTHTSFYNGLIFSREDFN